MNNLLLFLLAVGLGFVTAIPIGGSQIEMAKRVLSGQRWAAAMVILGSVSSDILYGIVAVFGIAPFMDTPWVLAAFNAVGALVLWVLAFVTVRESRRPSGIDWQHPSLKKKRVAYVTGFSLAASNPPMMLIWLLGVTLAKQFGLASPFTPGVKALYIAGGALGLAGYLSILGMVMHRIKRSIPVHALWKVYFWLGIALFVLSFYFVYGAGKYFLRGA
jgi:threonine/homoserine/homoserine lactone efflux protein